MSVLGLKKFFGLHGEESACPISTSDNLTTRALPASWYTSEELYELERRAVFSRKWMLVTHKLRLPETGNFLSFMIAGYPFFVIRDGEGNINAFNNVNRHCAFPVVTEQEGTANLLSCKYHGWSYGLNGKLAKAPGYRELQGFEKAQNSLSPIHIHIDRNGFIWANLDAKEIPETSWEDDFKDIDLQPRFKEFDFNDYEFDHTWEMDGAYNWKVLADNYNECYHCQTAHPDVGESLADLNAYSVDTVNGSIIHFANAKPEQISRGLRIATTFYFPNSSMTVTPHFFFMQRVVPTSVKTCSMQYEVYRNKNSSEEDFQLVDQMFKRVMNEDKYLCNETQKNLETGVFVNGQLHPRWEKGPLYFQSTVRKLVQDHYQREQDEGQEIWPARQRLPSNTDTTQKGLDFSDMPNENLPQDCGAPECFQTSQFGLPKATSSPASGIAVS